MYNTQAANEPRINYVTDMGNNESLRRGVFQDSDGTYTALTLANSKSDFKTKRGAINWLKKRGFDEYGCRLDQ